MILFIGENTPLYFTMPCDPAATNTLHVELRHPQYGLLQEWERSELTFPSSDDYVVEIPVTESEDYQRGSCQLIVRYTDMDDAKHYLSPMTVTILDPDNANDLMSASSLMEHGAEIPTQVAVEKDYNTYNTYEVVDTNSDTSIGHWSDLYVNQFLGCLKSYYDYRWKVEDVESIFSYGHNTAVDATYTTGGTEIDCSAYVALGLMGIDFLHSPYASLAVSGEDDDDTGEDDEDEEDDDTDDTDSESDTGFAFTLTADWAIDLADKDFPLNGALTHVRTAAQMCELLEESGWELIYESDFSNVRRGDIIFYAKVIDGEYRQPDRYKKVSHVAVVSSVYDNDADHSDYNVPTTYPQIHTMYEVTSFTKHPEKVVINTVLEKRSPEYIVSICRPHFGAASNLAVSGSGYALNGTYDINAMNQDGCYYLTSKTTDDLPDGLKNCTSCTLEVQTAYTRWGKPMAVKQTLTKLPSNAAYASTEPYVWTRTNYCYGTSYEFDSGHWSAWTELDGIALNNNISTLQTDIDELQENEITTDDAEEAEDVDTPSATGIPAGFISLIQTLFRGAVFNDEKISDPETTIAALSKYASSSSSISVSFSGGVLALSGFKSTPTISAS